MEISATELRQKLYRILDLVAERGEVITIFRKGKKIRIALDRNQKGKRSDRLIPHDTIVGDVDTLHQERPWEWKEENNLHGVS